MTHGEELDVLTGFEYPLGTAAALVEVREWECAIILTAEHQD